MSITREHKSKFLGLACRMSPENVCCDGEVSMAQARRRMGTLRNMWSDLEKTVGRTVTEDEVWQWSREDPVL